jgi:hypothetical protein
MMTLKKHQSVTSLDAKVGIIGRVPPIANPVTFGGGETSDLRTFFSVTGFGGWVIG